MNVSYVRVLWEVSAGNRRRARRTAGGDGELRGITRTPFDLSEVPHLDIKWQSISAHTGVSTLTSTRIKDSKTSLFRKPKGGPPMMPMMP